MAGLQWFWVLGLGSAGLAGIFAAYLFIPHVTSRIDKFMTMDAETVSQPLLAMKAFTSGGFFGKGPGEGTIKRILPDSHTDYIAAVSAEEFGIIFVMLLVALFAFIVLRGLTHALKLEDPFCRFATAGLILLFGLQSSINLLVNLNLIPAKGMTLPFVSYGGSSLLAVAYAMGLVL
eukprot:gene17530-23807_t